MSHQMWLINSDKMINISPIVGNLSWRSNIDELGTELNFTLATNDDRYTPRNPINLESIVILKNDKHEITRCKIISEDRQGRSPVEYTAFDFSFYLNKSKRVYQFNRITATKAIQRICNENNIPVHKIANMNTKIDKIYTDDTLSDVIKDILTQVEQDTGTMYRFEMFQGKFHVYKPHDIVIKPKIKLVVGWGKQDGSNVIGNPTRNRSIEEMKNRIQVVSNGEVVAELSDSNLMKKYGLLSDIVDIDEEDISKARNIAKNTLKELGKIFETTSIEMMGDDSVVAGRLIEVVEPVTGMKGKYMIESAQHNVSNGIHRMSLDLKGVE